MIIRVASNHDIRAIHECLSDAFAPFETVYTREAYRHTVLGIDELRDRLAAMKTFVADSSGTLLGTLSAQVLDDARGFLRGMAVRQNAQGQGCGTHLLRSALTYLRLKGCSSVLLGTTSNLRAAIRLYEKHGFRPTGRVTDFFGMEHIEYERTLDP